MYKMLHKALNVKAKFFLEFRNYHTQACKLVLYVHGRKDLRSEINQVSRTRSINDYPKAS